jgi:3-oxoadipate enol-lactonase
MNRMLLDMDLTADLARITCPTLLCAGLQDNLLPPAAIEAIAAMIPGSRYIEIDSGHFMAVQTPERLLEQVLPFLKGQ